MREYMRVIPRDLFNEADLLKCYGRLYILLRNTPKHYAKLEQEDHGPFEVSQDQGTGAITLENVTLRVRGRRVELERGLNSREPWPLLLRTDEEAEAFRVFDEQGNLSADMLAFIQQSPDIGCQECSDGGNRHDPCLACGRGSDPVFDGYMGKEGWRNMCCDAPYGPDHMLDCDGLYTNHQPRN